MSEILISPADLAELIKSKPVVLIDTRFPPQYAQGHLPGAINMPEIFTYLAMSTPEGADELEAEFAEAFSEAGLSGKETAVIYEQSMDTGYGQSCRGYFLLSAFGYPNVKVLHGGVDAWRAAGLPVTTETTSSKMAQFPIVPEARSLIVDSRKVLQAIDDQNVVLLDVRDVDEWIGDSSSPYGKDFSPRKGRIPGARWIEWYRFMKPTADGQRFKSKDEILAECATAGITPSDEVILYCFKGARASNTFLALKNAGFPDLKMYFGSWNEWSRDPLLPIETGPPQPISIAS
jgi:thiosulfate/3-mercaptopyruvate sulfurtransferase